MQRLGLSSGIRPPTIDLFRVTFRTGCTWVAHTLRHLHMQFWKAFSKTCIIPIPNGSVLPARQGFRGLRIPNRGSSPRVVLIHYPNCDIEIATFLRKRLSAYPHSLHPPDRTSFHHLSSSDGSLPSACDRSLCRPRYSSHGERRLPAIAPWPPPFDG